MYYVGHSSDPERRLRQHLEGHGSGSNIDKDAWIAELRDAGMLPQMTILEDVADPQTAREREGRSIFHMLRRGEPLTNSQAYFRHLASAAREADLDYLGAPLDAPGWQVLIAAQQKDLRERGNGTALTELDTGDLAWF